MTAKLHELKAGDYLICIDTAYIARIQGERLTVDTYFVIAAQEPIEDRKEEQLYSGRSRGEYVLSKNMRAPTKHLAHSFFDDRWFKFDA